jgi:hypothetical protein
MNLKVGGVKNLKDLGGKPLPKSQPIVKLILDSTGEDVSTEKPPKATASSLPGQFSVRYNGRKFVETVTVEVWDTAPKRHVLLGRAHIDCAQGPEGLAWPKGGWIPTIPVEGWYGIDIEDTNMLKRKKKLQEKQVKKLEKRRKAAEKRENNAERRMAQRLANQANMKEKLTKQTLNTLWKKVDTDGSGEMSKVELGIVLGQMGKDASPEAVDVLFLEIDTDADGTIGYDEFEAWYLQQDAEDMNAMLGVDEKIELDPNYTSSEEEEEEEEDDTDADSQGQVQITYVYDGPSVCHLTSPNCCLSKLWLSAPTNIQCSLKVRAANIMD